VCGGGGKKANDAGKKEGKAFVRTIVRLAGAPSGKKNDGKKGQKKRYAESIVERQMTPRGSYTGKALPHEKKGSGICPLPEEPQPRFAHPKWFRKPIEVTGKRKYPARANAARPRPPPGHQSQKKHRIQKIASTTERGKSGKNRTEKSARHHLAHQGPPTAVHRYVEYSDRIHRENPARQPQAPRTSSEKKKSRGKKNRKTPEGKKIDTAKERGYQQTQQAGQRE